MPLVANSLFEITAPDGTVVGFAACETEADTQIAKHLLPGAAAFFGDARWPTRAVAVKTVADWMEARMAGYKVVRVGG
jgi:hypothetical protein